LFTAQAPMIAQYLRRLIPGAGITRPVKRPVAGLAGAEFFSSPHAGTSSVTLIQGQGKNVKLSRYTPWWRLG
jgi:hypothetical protein